MPQQTQQRQRYNAQQYAAQNYRGRVQKSIPLPKVAAAIMLVAVIGAVGFFGFRAFAGGGQISASQATQSVATSASGAAEIVMTLKGSDTVLVQRGESYVEPGCQATDAQDGLISENVIVSGKVDANKTGEYTITYSAKNSRGQQAQRQRTVKVVDDIGAKADAVPVMMYHYVYTNGDRPDSVDGNYILDTDLEAQLKWLTENNYYFPSFAELNAFVKGGHSLPAKSIILTFDDGETGCLKYGGGLMEKYKVPMTSFLVCWDNSEAAKRNANPYIQFESHSYNMHRAGGSSGHGGIMTSMSQQEIQDDLNEAAKLLHSNDAFAYPYGDAPETGVAACSANGILCAFTTEYGMAHVGDNPDRLSRIRVLGQADLGSFIASING